jgi:hypothetical protein
MRKEELMARSFPMVFMPNTFLTTALWRLGRKELLPELKNNNIAVLLLF